MASRRCVMDFIDQAKTYIKQRVPLFTPFIKVGILGDGNSIAIRKTPGAPPERYLEGSKTIMYPFQVLVQHKSNKTSYETTQAIEDALDGLTNGAIVSNDGSFIFNKCDVYSTTNFVEKNSKSYMYTAMFQAELFIEKEA